MAITAFGRRQSILFRETEATLLITYTRRFLDLHFLFDYIS